MRTIHKKHGFTLIELSVVILILSIMLGGVMAIVTQNIRIQKNAEMAEKMETIREALLAYAKAYRRLPCPSDITQTIDSANFGVEGAPSGYTCNGGTPAANYVTGTNTVYGGGLPVKELGLPLEYAFDAWNNRFLYAVDATMVYSVSPLPFIANAPASGPGDIVILDREINTITNDAIYVVVSHGPNGHGAWINSGASRKNNNSANVAEQTNCHCNSSAVATAFTSSFYFMPPYASTTALNQYDDLTIYAKRSDMLLTEEMNAE
ncbi:MAG: type II secretion system protein [Alphaproteobacteria bacterium]